jgi:hypothetical protein
MASAEQYDDAPIAGKEHRVKMPREGEQQSSEQFHIT